MRLCSWCGRDATFFYLVRTDLPDEFAIVRRCASHKFHDDSLSDRIRESEFSAWAGEPIGVSSVCGYFLREQGDFCQSEGALFYRLTHTVSGVVSRCQSHPVWKYGNHMPVTYEEVVTMEVLGS